MTLESKIERQHRDIAKAAGWFVEKITAAGRGGFPDRFYAKDGRVVLLEWKRPGGRVSRQQELRHEELRRAGVAVYVVDNVEDANRILGITLQRIPNVAHSRGRTSDTCAFDL